MLVDAQYKKKFADMLLALSCLRETSVNTLLEEIKAISSLVTI
jgi:hypothetical protein